LLQFIVDSNRFCLIFWPEEDSVSIVKERDIVAPFNNRADEMVDVKIGRQQFSGILKKGVATLAEIREAEEEHLRRSKSENSISQNNKETKRQEKRKSKTARKRPLQDRTNNTSTPAIKRGKRNGPSTLQNKSKEPTGSFLAVMSHDSTAPPLSDLDSSIAEPIPIQDSTIDEPIPIQNSTIDEVGPF
jgi:hypothetical protein